MNRILGALSVAGLALGSLPSLAHAYEIQKTSGGKEIHWYYMPEPFYIDTHGYSGITDGTLLDAEKASFTVWEDVPMCDARYDVKTSAHGVSDIFNDGNKPGRDRKNELAFVETDWSGRVGAGNQSGLIALTFTYFADTTGKILENDIVANAVDYTWSTDDGAVQTDVANFLTHEVGHSYGLFHSADPNATMFATGTSGETKKRDLNQDDIDAITHLYKPGCCKHTRTGDALALIGCDVTNGKTPGALVWLGALAIVPAFVLLRRRSRKTAAAVLGGGLVLGFAGSARATTALDLSLTDLVHQSDAVVRGHVVYDEAITNPGGSIVTITQIEVDEVVAGAAPKVVILVQPGGKPADSDVGLIVSGTARFAIGDEVLVFASAAAGQTGFGEAFPDAYGPVAFSEGAFRVTRENGIARVLRDMGGMSRVGRDGSPVELDSLSGLTLDKMVSLVRGVR